MTSVSPEHVLAEINREHQADLALAERYAGGEQGAYALIDPHGARMVLKWSVGVAPLQRFRRAARIAERLRGRGYPAPQYVYAGYVQDISYTIQRELPGAPMQRLTPDLLAPLLALNRLQAGRARADQPPWPHVVVDTVLRGGAGYCLLDTMRAHSARTSQLLDTLQTIVAAHTATRCATNDVVHFDFTPANILVDGGRISGVIDWDGACAGDRGFDLATLLFYTYDQAETRAPLWRQATAISGPAALRIYLAHLILRQVEWSIRHHGGSAAARWLARADEIILRIYALEG